MTIHHEGFKTIALTTLFILVLNWSIAHFFPENELLRKTVVLASVALAVIILQFFRKPVRKAIINPKHIIAPADGKVVVIEETVETEYFQGPRRQVSIFMSPFNVHQNFNPISGIVSFFKYHPGKFLVAWDPKSSTDNERHSVVIKKGSTEVLVKQIAGALAKRIVNYLSVGQKVNKTDEFGFIKFGSRVDMLLPVGTKINVQLNEVVKGGVTVIATLS